MMKIQKSVPCFVFPMGVEAYPFLNRVEILSRKRIGGATYRTAFFEGSHIMVVRCGIGAGRAAASIRNLETKPLWIMAVGTAGALDESLKMGDLVVSSDIVAGEVKAPLFKSDKALTELVCQAANRVGVKYFVSRVASMSKPIFARKAREELYRNTGAIAVDMESYWIAEEAEKIVVPFTVIRVISDDTNSPALPDYGNLRDLVRSPFQLIKTIPEVLRWRAFLRDFKASIKVLPPVLVEIIRTWNKDSYFP